MGPMAGPMFGPMQMRPAGPMGAKGGLEGAWAEAQGKGQAKGKGKGSYALGMRMQDQLADHLHGPACGPECAPGMGADMFKYQARPQAQVPWADQFQPEAAAAAQQHMAAASSSSQMPAFAPVDNKWGEQFQAEGGPRPQGPMMGPMMPAGPMMMGPMMGGPAQQNWGQEYNQQMQPPASSSSMKAPEEKLDMSHANEMVEMLRTSGNPKFANSSFVEFVDQVSKGDLVLKGNSVLDKNGKEIDWDELYDPKAAKISNADLEGFEKEKLKKLNFTFTLELTRPRSSDAWGPMARGVFV